MRVPLSHPLPRIVAQDETYLQPLAALAAALVATSGPGPAIDIGANIGDTAVVIASGGLTAVTCVEGNAMFLPILRENARLAGRRGWNFRVLDRFVLDDGEPIDYRIETKGGTASLVPAGGRGSGRTAPLMITASELLRPFDEIALVKIDTDGLDLRILRSLIAALNGRALRAVFVEYTPALEQVGDEFDLLAGVGLDAVLVYDHLGRFVAQTDARDRGRIEELAASARRRDVYYDIVAIPADSAVVDLLRERG
jgi:FkbM family methyltransferase